MVVISSSRAASATISSSAWATGVRVAWGMGASLRTWTPYKSSAGGLMHVPESNHAFLTGRIQRIELYREDINFVHLHYRAVIFPRISGRGIYQKTERETHVTYFCIEWSQLALTWTKFSLLAHGRLG